MSWCNQFFFFYIYYLYFCIQILIYIIDCNIIETRWALTHLVTEGVAVLLMQKGVGFNAAEKTVRITSIWVIFTFCAYMLGKFELFVPCIFPSLRIVTHVMWSHFHSIHAISGCFCCDADDMGDDAIRLLSLPVDSSAPPLLPSPCSNSVCEVLVSI